MELQAWEEKFIDAIRPVLRPAEDTDARPLAGMVAAFALGILGGWAGLVGLFRVVVPGPTELILFQGFPLLRLANLFGTATGIVGSLAVLVGAEWMLRRRPGGRETARAACRLLAICALLWFVFAVGSYSSNWSMASVTGMVPSTFGTAATAWTLQGVTYYLLRGGRRREAGSPDHPA